jgi:hypothetical protein
MRPVLMFCSTSSLLWGWKKYPRTYRRHSTVAQQIVEESEAEWLMTRAESKE